MYTFTKSRGLQCVLSDILTIPVLHSYNRPYQLICSGKRARLYAITILERTVILNGVSSPAGFLSETSARTYWASGAFIKNIDIFNRTL